MLKFSLKNVFVSSEFWRILCEALFALGKLISFIVDDGGDGFGDESVDH